ncbi:hypothetical protein [Clostridium botulinum]|uniref:hypothetical protein n=1 Tax=Clostridium botulinum TaxID=1491 RepID=UPI001C9B8D9E|nr:hypothetical protein [Clostridium botulinum]MBY6842840.1 hypothetical protein [Clostridium botulinum]
MNRYTGENEFKLVYKIGVCSDEIITEHKEFMCEADAKTYLQMKDSRMYIISIENLEMIV